MKSSLGRRPMMAASVIAVLLSACSLNPDARKQRYIASGDGYLKKGAYREAAIEFANAVKIDPNDTGAHFQLAQTYLDLQQIDRSYQEFSRTVELQPDNYAAREAMANLLIGARKFPEAQEQVDFLLKTRPNDAVAHSTLSSLLAAQGKVPGAIVALQQAIAIDPGQWELYLSLAVLHLRNNQADAAEASFKKVIELNPKAMPARLALGAFYQSHKRPAEAEREFHEAIAMDPSSAEARTQLARFYLAQGKQTEAEQVLLGATRDLPHTPESFLALSNFYFTTGSPEKAVQAYKALYQDRPNDLQVKKKYIELLFQTRHYDEAQRLDDEILKKDPKDDDALVLLSQIEISEGNVNEAAQTLQSVTANAPNNSQAHYALGIAFEKQGYLQRAEGEWREALRLSPDLLDAQQALAEVAMRSGDMNTLRDAATQIIALKPGSPDGYALRALSNINRQQYADAQIDIQEAIEIAPQSSFGYVQLGNLKFVQKQYVEAAKAYADALDRNSQSTDALRGLISSYVAQKQADKAIAAARTAIGKSPSDSAFYALLGGVLFHSKVDLNGAEAAFEKSTALDNHNYDAVLQLCQVLAAMGKVDQAIATGEQSLKQNPRQAGLDIVIGNLYESKSDWTKAESAYQNALALNSQNPIASNDLARTMVHAGGSLDIALTLAQTARRGLPDSPSTADTLGWIYYQQGVYPLAITNLQEAIRVQQKNRIPDNPDIHYHLGMAYAKVNQSTLARQQFEQVLKGFPNYPNAAELKSELAHLRS